MLQSARAFVSSSWQPQLVLYCSGLCHGAMPHCVSHDLFACCEAAPLCPGTAKLSARTQLERDGVHPPDFSEARRRVSSVPRWSLQLSRQRGEPGALHSHLRFVFFRATWLETLAPSPRCARATYLPAARGGGWPRDLPTYLPALGVART